MSDGLVFKNNIIYPTDAMITLNGCYVTSKDEKVIIETKDINREKRIDIKLRGFSSLFEAKKLAEILSVILIDSNGFLRQNENIIINKNKDGSTTINLK